jgi:hypothetical protein
LFSLSKDSNNNNNNETLNAFEDKSWHTQSKMNNFRTIGVFDSKNKT